MTLVCYALQAQRRLPWKLAGLAGLFVFVLWLSNLRIEIPGGKGREISFEQFTVNLQSMTGNVGRDGMDSTKEWQT